jgi:hypothetical protein
MMATLRLSWGAWLGDVESFSGRVRHFADWDDLVRHLQAKYASPPRAAAFPCDPLYLPPEGSGT